MMRRLRAIVTDEYPDMSVQDGEFSRTAVAHADEDHEDCDVMTMHFYAKW